MKKTLIRLVALAMALILCMGLMSTAYATETAPTGTDPAFSETQPQQNEEPEEGGIDWSFMLTAVMLGLASILHTRNQKRRREQRR